MPPKKVAEAPPPPPVEGAKFAYVSCGDFKVMVNCNCRLDIIIDYVRLELIKMMNSKVDEMKNDPTLMAEQTFQENIDKYVILLSKVMAITNVEDFDLFIDGANINCKQVLLIVIYSIF